MKLVKGIGIGLGVTTAVAGAAFGRLVYRFTEGKKEEELAWARGHYAPLPDVGAVDSLTILPLIDFYPSRPDLKGEPGVSYLIRADETTILFDVGFNPRARHPSPLLRNMEQLGVNMSDLDMIVISHAHIDHLGGVTPAREGRFAPSAGPVDLDGIPAYVPEPLQNPSAETIVVNGPQRLAPGVATLGPIARQLFFLGWTPEQSLAARVQGKGIVLIIGCGHPTLQRIIDRAEMLFDDPIYGVVGGLHYPVTDSRSRRLGIPLQQFLGAGKWPWDPITQSEVLDAIDYLRQRDPQLVSLSPHDSCDWSLDAFRDAFGDAYFDLLVGRPIEIRS